MSYQRRSEKKRHREIQHQEQVAAEFEHLFPERLKPNREPMHSIVVDNAADAWKLLLWALPRVKTDYSSHWSYGYGGRVVNKSVSVEMQAQRFEDEPVKHIYSVVFPRYVWEDAKAGHTEAHAEKKVREDIFGKGK